MRIAELSRQSGISVATIKYYLREGLLEAGERAGAANQARYGDEHVHRLRLIRTLRDVGGLPVAATRHVLAAVDDPGLDVNALLAVVASALAPERSGPVDPVVRGEVDDFLMDLFGWSATRVDTEPWRDRLADSLNALRSLGRPAGADVFRPHAVLADELGAAEVASIPADLDRAATVEAMVVGTVVFETALVALRHIAHAEHARTHF